MENFLDSYKFKQWHKCLIDNGMQIKKITPLHTIHKSNGDALFGLLHVDATDPAGNTLLPAVLIRGHYVCVITCLIDKETNERYFLLVRQRRVADGSVFYEHPAGMCDSEQDPWQVAIKEVEEETGLAIGKENLGLLLDRPLFSSPGLLDEAGYFFYCEVFLSHSEILSYSDRQTGASDENEFITTYLCRFNELNDRIKNTSGVLLNLLYQQRIHD